MPREELDEASAILQEAKASVSDADVRERLETQAEQIALLAERDQAPDHGRLDRHQHALRGMKTDAPEIADELDAANDLINAFRQTIEGV